MSKFWSPFVEELTPYVPGEQPRDRKIIKLNTNENPYGPSPAALAAIRDAAGDSLRLYPDPESAELVETLANYYHIKTSQVFVGNGSDEVLAHTFHALLNHDRSVLFPDITYSFYPVYCTLYGIPYRTIALNEHFEIETSDYDQPNGGIIFANPNAPTGRTTPLESIETLLQRHRDSVVVIDEAYVAFGATSAMPLIAQYDNLLIVQTLSKSHGLAGLRVGMAFGDSQLIEALKRVKNSFNSYPLDGLAQAGAVAALRDTAYFNETRQRVVASRERLCAAMTDLGFTVLPSSANFIFVTHQQESAASIAKGLREKSIIVRHFDHPRTAEYLRITIGTDEELDSLTAALKDALR